MNRQTICRITAGMPIAAAMAAAGQSPALLRVAWVSPERAGSTSPNLTAFRTGLRELGYMEGKNLVIDTWWGEGSSERLEQMAGDIVRARPDVIVTGSGVAVLPMMRAGVKLPIVFVLSADPVEAKVVASSRGPVAT
jgi:putative tryptophan/tyrosine transport system substrate-binding protein